MVTPCREKEGKGGEREGGGERESEREREQEVLVVGVVKRHEGQHGLEGKACGTNLAVHCARMTVKFEGVLMAQGKRKRVLALRVVVG